MKDLIKLANECMAELDAIGIQYAKNIKWEINTRAKKRWGLCSKKPDGSYVISISNSLLDDYVPDTSTKNTINHELLHSVKGVKGHGPEWKRLADKVNRAYGYNIKRCSGDEEKGVVLPEPAPKVIKHKFRCKKCSQILEYTRESKFTKDYKSYRCGICHGTFEKLF